MQLIQKVILISISVLQCCIANAYGDDKDKFDWMNSNVKSFNPGCIEAPIFSGMNQSQTTLNAENDMWVPTGVRVQEGKMFSMAWNLRGVAPRPQKYRVLYRIDPRFSKPQVFIQKYDYVQKKYITDFNTYKTQTLPYYQKKADIFSNQRLDDVNDYFNFSGRPKIQVKKGDVINITLDTNGSFFGSEGDMQAGLDGFVNKELTIFTDSSGLRNKIIYASASSWCSDIMGGNSTTPTADYMSRCAIPNKYLNIGDQIPQLIGKPSDSNFTSKIISIPSCPDNADDQNNNQVCFYDAGRGVKVDVAGFTIKDHKQKFVKSPFTGKYFLYHYSDATGDLGFTTQWPIVGMYDDFLQTMAEWKSFIGNDDFVSNTNFSTYLNSKVNAPVNFFHFGAYTMEIEIGQANPVISGNDLNSIKVDYFISESDTPSVYSVVNSASQDFRGNAYASGFLWLRASGASSMSGNMIVNIANYTGSTWFSTVVYGSLVLPLREKYNELSRTIYEKLIRNAALKNIAKGLLVLYIVIYGLAFLAGAVQITATDIVIRVLKIGVIVALFSKTSWSFFNDNLFHVFIGGSDYLLNTVIGVTSNVGNIFGFIDPIFDRYANGNVWALLAIQLLQIQNGLAFFACLTIYSILTYFRAVLEVIINYCLAFLGIAVMISLAPFFILLMLFEQTKSMFDNWLSTLFSYMIQPTILLIFFLLIDQLMAEYITGVVVRACWGSLIDLKIAIDLSNLGIPISFSFSLPFLPSIPFYIPEVKEVTSIGDFFNKTGTFVRVATSCFIFFIYCKLAAGLIEYVTLVTQYLTNVLAARRDGKLQESQNPVKDIMNDMKKLASPVTSTARGIGNFAKEKLIDQKITHRTKAGVNDVDYSKIRKKGADGEEGENIDGNQKDGGEAISKSSGTVSNLHQGADSSPVAKGDDDVRKKADSQMGGRPASSASLSGAKFGSQDTPKSSVELGSALDISDPIGGSGGGSGRDDVQRRSLRGEDVVAPPVVQPDLVDQGAKPPSKGQVDVGSKAKKVERAGGIPKKDEE